MYNGAKSGLKRKSSGMATQETNEKLTQVGPGTEMGEYGLVAERCAHRGISMAYGIPQENGLRCAYHGWTYNTAGQVVDMPFEPACLPLKITAYPVEELGGLIFAYLGPEPAPLLPRYDLFVRDDLDRNIEIVE